MISSTSGTIIPLLSATGAYTVTYHFSNGSCANTTTTTVSIVNCFGNGRNDAITNTDPHLNLQTKMEITAYPNPSETFFNLKVSSPRNEDVVVKVFDMSGKLVQTLKGAPQQTFRFGEHVVNGMYVVEVWQAGEKVMTKVVKQ
jgi:Secretion system C-terminal sorting domain